MKAELVAEIKNLPENLDGYIVVHAVQGELWYWGRFSTKEKAKQAALEVDGFVMREPC